MSDSATSARMNSTSFALGDGLPTSATTLRLLVFRCRNNGDRSRLLASCGKDSAAPQGPWRRAGSPPGGSTLMTSAPWSAKSLPRYGPEIPVASSSTRMPANNWLTAAPLPGPEGQFPTGQVWPMTELRLPARQPIEARIGASVTSSLSTSLSAAMPSRLAVMAMPRSNAGTYAAIVRKPGTPPPWE